MKNITLSLLALTFTVSAQADIIKCYFTEPFIATSYSMTQSTLTETDLVTKAKSVTKNVSFQIKGAGLFELVSKEGKVLQTLNLNNNGSDGMSDLTYPYDATYNAFKIGDFELIGGCTSNYLHAKED